jgi:hypothetical protein
MLRAKSDQDMRWRRFDLPSQSDLPRATAFTGHINGARAAILCHCVRSAPELRGLPQAEGYQRGRDPAVRPPRGVEHIKVWIFSSLQTEYASGPEACRADAWLEMAGGFSALVLTSKRSPPAASAA